MLVIGTSTYGDLNVRANDSLYLGMNPNLQIHSRAREPIHIDKNGGVEYCFDSRKLHEEE